MTEELTIVFKHGTLDPGFALTGIQEELQERQTPSSGFELYGEQVDLTQVSRRLKAGGRRSFNLIGRGFVFHLGSVRNFQLDFLAIKSIQEDFASWDKWACRFVRESNFTMAWLADAEYEFWQNAEDPLQYTSRGKAHADLPKKSNNLTPPLEQTVIDISLNPGRRLLRNGYYEIVGAVMWLGERFWKFSGAEKSKVEETDWLQVSTCSSTTLRVQASPKCFTSETASDGDLQRKLRQILFPEALRHR